VIIYLFPKDKNPKRRRLYPAWGDKSTALPLLPTASSTYQVLPRILAYKLSDVKWRNCHLTHCF
jgi:hypothetical protein